MARRNAEGIAATRHSAFFDGLADVARHEQRVGQRDAGQQPAVLAVAGDVVDVGGPVPPESDSASRALGKDQGHQSSHGARPEHGGFHREWPFSCRRLQDVDVARAWGRCDRLIPFNPQSQKQKNPCGRRFPPVRFNRGPTVKPRTSVWPSLRRHAPDVSRPGVHRPRSGRPAERDAADSCAREGRHGFVRRNRQMATIFESSQQQIGDTNFMERRRQPVGRPGVERRQFSDARQIVPSRNRRAREGRRPVQAHPSPPVHHVRRAL